MVNQPPPQPPLPPLLTLEEAAEFMSTDLGEPWTARTILGCAVRSEICIYSRIPTAVRLVRSEPVEGEATDACCPAGALPRISADAVLSLLATGTADFKDLSYPRTVHFFGEPVETTVAVWTIAEGETAPQMTIEGCRVHEEGSPSRTMLRASSWKGACCRSFPRDRS